MTQTLTTSNTSTSATRTAAVMQEVTDRMVEMISAGIANPDEWRKTWSGVTDRLTGAVNAATGKHYRGGNMMVLAMFGGLGPFATYKQWQTLGGQVRKGAKGITILVPKTYSRTDDNGEEHTGVYFGTATVFGADCVDGWNPPEGGTLVPADGWIAEVVKGAGVVVANGQPACARNGSVLYMPDREKFADEASWFCTFAHELVHWSGRDDRAGERVKGAAFGDPAYAAEELVAELGAAMAASLVGISATPRPDHAHYLAHWLKACAGDQGPARLWQIASVASQAVAWLDDQRP